MNVLVGEVEFFNSGDRNRLVVAEVERVSVGDRVDVDLGNVREGTIREVDGIVAVATDDRIVSGVRLDMEGIVAVAALQRRVRTRRATVEPEHVLAVTTLQDVALPADQRVVAGAA